MNDEPNRNRRPQMRLAVAIVLAVGLASSAGLFDPFDRGAEDALLRLGSRLPPAAARDQPDVAVVAVDPQSLRALPDWPWPRRIYAEAVRTLDAAGARAVAFDIDFSTPRDARDDAEFAAAIAASERVALAAFRQRQALPGAGELEIANLPFESLERSAAAIGSVLVPVDTDGVVRRAPRSSEVAGRSFPSLALAALSIARGEPASPVEIEFFRVDYRREHPPYPVISMVDLIEGRFDPRDVAGRVVFIGATAAEFQDLWTTPLGPAQPGVFIQATAMRTLAAEQAGASIVRDLSLPAQLALLALLSLALGLSSVLSHAWRLLALGTAAAGIAVACVVLALGPGALLPPSSPLAAVALHYVLGLETVRRRFARRIAVQDSSLDALAGVGEATAGATPATASGVAGLDLALGLLGEVVGAGGVALLHTDASGELDGRRREWRPPGAEGDTPVGEPEAAARALAEGRVRILRGAMPARDRAAQTRAAGVTVYSPLHSDRDSVGVLVVECPDRRDLDATQLRTIATAGSQFALSARNLRLSDDLEKTFASSVAALATAVEARDGYTDLHCQRLVTFSSIMARRLGLPEDEVKAVELGALLHDVGKIGVPDFLLNKPGPLTAEERREMERHPEIGAQIVGSIHGLSKSTLDCVRHHHERWDGAGYPARLAGTDIPLVARIVSVVDRWDALSSPRPYKLSYPQQQVFEILDKSRGSECDPEVLDLFLAILAENSQDHLAPVVTRNAWGETS